MEKIENEKCPLCLKNTLTLIEDEQDVPYFGKVFIFSMNCSECGYRQSDVECAETREGSRYEFTIESKNDLNVRVVKSGGAVVRIPGLKTNIEPGIASEGYVSNMEGVLERVKKVLEGERDSAEDADVRKKAKNLLKRLWKVENGDEKLKIIIEDKSGNSAIISEKAIVKKIK